MPARKIACLGAGSRYFTRALGDLAVTPALAGSELALYDIDSHKQLRRSHENPAIEHLYAEFLGEPNGPKAHELLHTHYQARMPRGIR